MPIYNKKLSPYTILRLLILLYFLTAQQVAFAETKILSTEAVYTMGDGETPSFAEAAAIHKAKQLALEQAGTYVESYTKVQNYTLSTEEIQTITGGVIEVEVVEKTRTLVGDGLSIYVKIKATVTTDKMEELARRIKGRNVAEEYKKLQEEYSRLNKEIETWKQLINRTQPGPERDSALDQIREREKAFATVQRSETEFFQRLVSGEALFSKALGQLSQKRNEKDIVDALFQKILTQGNTIILGEPEINTTLQHPDMVKISVPVTISATETIKTAIEETARTLGGEITDEYTGYRVIRIGRDKETVLHLYNRIASLIFVIEIVLDNQNVRSCYDNHYEDAWSEWHIPIAPIKDFYSSYSEGLKLNLGNAYRTDREYIAVFNEPSIFKVNISVPIEEAKQVKTIRGKFKEANYKNEYYSIYSYTVKGIEECKRW